MFEKYNHVMICLPVYKSVFLSNNIKVRKCIYHTFNVPTCPLDNHCTYQTRQTHTFNLSTSLYIKDIICVLTCIVFNILQIFHIIWISFLCKSVFYRNPPLIILGTLNHLVQNLSAGPSPILCQ